MRRPNMPAMELTKYNTDRMGRQCQPQRGYLTQNLITLLYCLREQLPFVRVGYRPLSVAALSNVQVSSSTIQHEPPKIPLPLFIRLCSVPDENYIYVLYYICLRYTITLSRHGVNFPHVLSTNSCKFNHHLFFISLFQITSSLSPATSSLLMLSLYIYHLSMEIDYS